MVALQNSHRKEFVLVEQLHPQEKTPHKILNEVNCSHNTVTWAWLNVICAYQCNAMWNVALSMAIPPLCPETYRLDSKCCKHILSKSLQSFTERTQQVCLVARSRFSLKPAILVFSLLAQRPYLFTVAKRFLRAATHREVDLLTLAQFTLRLFMQVR